MSASCEPNTFLLTHPSFVALSDISSFLEVNQPWIERIIEKTLPIRTINLGDSFSFLGKKYTLKHDPLRKNGAWKQRDDLIVGAGVINFNKTVEDFLRKESYDFFEKESEYYSEKINLGFEKIVIRDGRSRWGSCSSSGTLSYSWRLGFAPIEIARYVCAHEVAHLKEMNHSSKFWTVVSSLDPLYVEHRKWLKKDGEKLKRIHFSRANES
ncbi:M48 family metallopeptidase [Alphaproteobacteria bacterium]|nr:M48 family metallopeptidase [Alphaproteobacteria bacterium]